MVWSKLLENSRLSRSEIGGGPPVCTPAPRKVSIKSRKCKRALTLAEVYTSPRG